MSEIDIYQKGFKDGFSAAKELIAPAQAQAPKPEPETVLPELGEGMPSDADMLLYATPFFASEEEKKSAAATDDADEEQK